MVVTLYTSSRNQKDAQLVTVLEMLLHVPVMRDGNFQMDLVSVCLYSFIIIIDHKAREIMYLVACVCLSGFTQATLCTTTTVYGVLVHHQGAICTTKAQYAPGCTRETIFFEKFCLSVCLSVCQRSRGSRSKVKWVKPSLKVIPVAGGLMSTSSCFFCFYSAPPPEKGMTLIPLIGLDIPQLVSFTQFIHV